MFQLGPLTIDFTPLLEVALTGNPFTLGWFILKSGGWIPVLYVTVRGFWWIWKKHIDQKVQSRWKWVLLSIDIPAENIQSPRAVENIMAHLAGAHDKPDLIQKFITGFAQPFFSLEIISIGGFVRFCIYTPVKFRDLVEAAIYAQYPSAEITEMEDYTPGTPNYYPDPRYDLWGTEWKLVKHQAYPIRTYEAFHDSTAEEAAFKDPMAALLETMSNLREGEQLWFQMLITCIASRSWQEESYRLIEKLAGIPSEHKPSWLERLFVIPHHLVAMTMDAFMPGDPEHTKKIKDDLPSKMLYLTPGEREVIEAIEKKAAKIGFHTKVRAVYLAPHEIFNKTRGRASLVGAMKQVATEDMNSLKPDTKKIGVHAHYFFKEWRKNWKKRKIMRAYKARSNWRGHIGYVLNIEELATIWHFPVAESVKAPLLRKAESKRGAPPHAIPSPASPHYRGVHVAQSPKHEEAPDNLPIG